MREIPWRAFEMMVHFDGHRPDAAEVWRYAAEVLERVGDVVTNDNQLGALVSYAYDVGLPNFDRSSVLARHRVGDYDGVRYALLLRPPVGRAFPGSIARRKAEAALYERSDDEDL
jgi:lysozyme